MMQEKLGIKSTTEPIANYLGEQWLLSEKERLEQEEQRLLFEKGRLERENKRAEQENRPAAAGRGEA